MPGFGGVLSWVVLFNGNGGILKGCCSVNLISCFCGRVRSHCDGVVEQTYISSKQKLLLVAMTSK